VQQSSSISIAGHVGRRKLATRPRQNRARAGTSLCAGHAWAGGPTRLLVMLNGIGRKQTYSLGVVVSHFDPFLRS
jgi:hypothetical protein